MLETGTDGSECTGSGGAVGTLIDSPTVEDDDAKAVLAVLAVANEGVGGGGGMKLLLLIRCCSFVYSLLLTSCVDVLGTVGAGVGMSAGDRLGGVGTSNILLAVISTLLDLGDSNGCVNDSVA